MHSTLPVSAACLTAQLRWARALSALHIERLRALGALPGPGELMPGTAVAPAEVEGRLMEYADGAPVPMTNALDAAGIALDRAAQGCDEVRLEAALRGEVDPLDALSTAFGLEERERVMLLLGLAVELDGRMSRLFAFAQNHFERPYLTLDLFDQMAAVPLPRTELVRLVDPGRPLLRYGLLRPLGLSGEVSLVHRPLGVAARVVRYCTGEVGLDAELFGWARLLPTPVMHPPFFVDEGLAPIWQSLSRQAEGCAHASWDFPVVALRGPFGAGGLRWAQELAARMKAGVLEVDLHALVTHSGDVEAAFRTAQREALLHGTVLYLRGWEAILGPEPEQRQANLDGLLRRALLGYPGAVILRLSRDDVDVPDVGRASEEVRLGHLSRAAAAALWTACLPQRLRAPDCDPDALSATYRLTPGRIQSTSEHATRRAAEAGRPVRRADVVQAIQEGVKSRLGSSARRVDSTLRWHDIVATDDVLIQLREMAARYRQRQRVLGDWGFGERFATAHGITALFEGPPGTGKTMAASIVARELGVDLYQIDLSRVVNRYVGETEKNLGRIFDEAERAEVMLLFDEADSLFSTRTSVSSANDRYANLEVNYLLQRLDQFTGIAILTTNFPDGMDAAFRRRIGIHVRFAKPELAERVELWRRMLSGGQAPVGEVRYALLARTYELTGGHIRNAVLRAAYLAAERDQVIDHALLDVCARIEMKAQGMLVAGNPYEELVPAPPTGP